MDKDNGIMGIFFVVSLVGATIFTVSMLIHWQELSNEAPRTKLTVQYDCRLAEISVDYPLQVKQACRKLLMPEIK